MSYEDESLNFKTLMIVLTIASLVTLAVSFCAFQIIKRSRIKKNQVKPSYQIKRTPIKRQEVLVRYPLSNDGPFFTEDHIEGLPEPIEEDYIET